MSALTKRLERGIEAIKLGDVEKAERLLDEVSVEPGSMEPIPGLLEGTQQRFEELRARLQGQTWAADLDPVAADSAWDVEAYDLDDVAAADDAWDDAWDEDDTDGADAADAALTVYSDGGTCGCGGDAVVTMRADEPGKRLSLSMEYVDDGALVEVERHEESFREVDVSAYQASDTLITVQSYNSSVVLQPGVEIPDVVASNLGHDIDPDRDWKECHVEEVRVIRTRLVY